MTINWKIEKKCLSLTGAGHYATLNQRLYGQTLITQQAYVDSKNDIYTASLVEVHTILKGRAEEKVIVVKKGGRVGNRTMMVSHSLRLLPQDEGIFFLQESSVEPLSDSAYRFENYEVYAGPQGCILLTVDQVSKAKIGYDPFDTYYDIVSQTMDVIEKQTGEKPVYLTNDRVYRSGVRYHFTNLSITGNIMTFDIHVNSLVGQKKLYQSGIVMGYNPLVFGSNLGTNGNLQILDGGISAGAAYDLGLVNQSNTKVKISMETVGSTTGLSTINTSETLLAKGKLIFLNPFLDPKLIPDIAQSFSLNQWFDDQTGQTFPFDTVVVDVDSKGLPIPIITSFSPNTVAAGIDQVIEIIGSNFGNYVDGTSSVLFTDANSGPNGFFKALTGDIEYWDPTKIRVVVPSVGRTLTNPAISNEVYAGTGKIQVCNDAGLCGTSATDLFVKFVVSNSWSDPGETPTDQSFPISLFGANTEKGFQMTFASNFSGDVDAVKAFNKALDTWKCATGLNYTTDPAYPNSSTTNSAVVSFAPLSGGKLGETIISFIDCQDGPNNVQAYLQSLTLQFDNSGSTIWYKGENETLIGAGMSDFQSIALHELGHAHLLWHVNQSTDLMWYLIPPENIKRKPRPNDTEGGNWVMDFSGVSLTGTTCSELTKPMLRAATASLPCALLLPSDQILPKEYPISIYPNPTNGTLNITYLEPITTSLEFSVLDLTQKVWVSQKVDRDAEMGNVSMDVTNLPSGVYILKIQGGNEKLLYEKFIKL